MQIGGSLPSSCSQFELIKIYKFSMQPCGCQVPWRIFSAKTAFTSLAQARDTQNRSRFFLFQVLYFLKNSDEGGNTGAPETTPADCVLPHHGGGHCHRGGVSPSGTGGTADFRTAQYHFRLWAGLVRPAGAGGTGAEGAGRKRCGTCGVSPPDGVRAVLFSRIVILLKKQ